MAFEHWWRSKYPTRATKECFDLMREAYEAGVKEEREACADACESEITRDGVVALQLAEVIRSRSNV